MRRTRPKFKVGQVVTYRGNRRLRRTITARYWDPKYPAWRYKFVEFGMRKDLAACWAVVEGELLSVKRK